MFQMKTKYLLVHVMTAIKAVEKVEGIEKTGNVRSFDAGLHSKRLKSNLYCLTLFHLNGVFGDPAEMNLSIIFKSTHPPPANIK